MGGDEMPTQEWAATFETKKISVQNSFSWTGDTEARLYVDNACVDRSQQKIASASTPVLRGVVKGNDGCPHVVEVFVKLSLFSVKCKICVDSCYVGGDRF